MYVNMPVCLSECRRVWELFVCVCLCATWAHTHASEGSQRTGTWIPAGGMGSISLNCFWPTSTLRSAKIIQKQFKYVETWVCFPLVSLHRGSCYWERNLSGGFLDPIGAWPLSWLGVTFCSPSLPGCIMTCMLAVVVTNFAQSSRSRNYWPDLTVICMPQHWHLTENPRQPEVGRAPVVGEDQLRGRGAPPIPWQTGDPHHLPHLPWKLLKEDELRVEGYFQKP